jgi:hypothetical protein
MKLFIAAVIILFMSSTLTVSSSLPQRVEVSGFVVAKHKLMGKSLSKDNLQTEMVILRLEKHEKLASESLYLIVYYQHRLDEPALPAEFFRFGKQWRLILARVSGCDSTVKKLITIYNEKGEASYSEENLHVLLDVAEGEQIPMEKVLPCYVLEPSNIKSLKLEN